MQVKNRLQINVFVLITVVAIIIFVLFIAVYRVNQAINTMQIVDQIKTGVLERVLFREDYLRNGNERARLQWFSMHKQIGRYLIFAKKRFKDVKVKTIIEEMIKNHESIGKINSEIFHNRQKKSFKEHSTLSLQIEERLTTQLNMRLYSTVLYSRQLQAFGRELLISTLKMAGWSIICALFIITLVVMVNTWTMGRTIVHRMDTLREGTSVIGDGNLEHLIKIEGDDEFVKLSEAINAMTAKLRKSYNSLEKEVLERKWTEEALLQSEGKYRNIVDTAQEGILVSDLKGRITFANEALARMLGYSVDELVGKPDQKLVKENERTLGLERLLKQEQGNSGVYEIWMLSKNETERCMLVSESPILDAQKQRISTLGMYIDITNRKKAEDALLESEKHLKIMNENLENLVIRRTEQVRSLSTALTIAEQRERKRVSYVLHEDLQQFLLGARFILSQIVKDQRPSQNDKDEFNEIVDALNILNKAIKTTKTLSIELNPPILNNQGLDAALKWLINHIKKNMVYILKLL